MQRWCPISLARCAVRNNSTRRARTLPTDRRSRTLQRPRRRRRTCFFSKYASDGKHSRVHRLAFSIVASTAAALEKLSSPSTAHSKCAIDHCPHGVRYTSTRGTVNSSTRYLTRCKTRCTPRAWLARGSAAATARARGREADGGTDGGQEERKDKRRCVCVCCWCSRPSVSVFVSTRPSECARPLPQQPPPTTAPCRTHAHSRTLAIAREPTSASMVRCDRSMRSVLLFLVSPEIPEQLSRKIRSFCKVPHELMTALATLTAALSPFSRRPASASRRCVPSSAAAVCASLPSLALAPSVLLCACALSL